MDSTTLNPKLHTRAAYTTVSFYTSLNAYIDCFDPRPKYMAAMPGADLSPTEWLKHAGNFASELPDQQAQLVGLTAEIRRLVAEKQYGTARQMVRQGLHEAEEQIRAALR